MPISSFSLLDVTSFREYWTCVSDICPPPLLPLTKATIQPGTENERIGLVRNSMFQNPLILKSELGRTRRRCAKIPGANFVYGLAAHGTDGGVPEAIGHWHVMPLPAIKRKEIPKDFIHMNSNGIKAGLFTAKEHHLYRQHHELHCKTTVAKTFPKNVPRLPDAMTYGNKKMLFFSGLKESREHCTNTSRLYLMLIEK
uniref:Cilia and flagella associated protein 77 n=1 Tax=Naja naja TaxID=35670 RepID=A0A8C6VCM4_NAJNA